MYVTRFRVRGNGHFPADMLRYDSCWPVGSEDVNGIFARYEELCDDWTKDRTVDLLTAHGAKGSPHITRERWTSFGWAVVDVRPAMRA